MRKNYIKTLLLVWTIGLLITNTIHAGIPVWSFKSLNDTSVPVSSSGQVTIRYTVTNNSIKTHTLRMKPIRGVQATGCTAPLLGHKACTLTLTIIGARLNGDVVGGPILCEHANPNQCYQPSPAMRLNVKKTLSTKVAVGNFFSTISTALLGVKRGENGTWSYPVSGGYTFRGTSCTGSGSTAICTAVGNYSGVNGGALFVSKNGGASWSNVTPSDGGTYYSTSCTGALATVCTAVGINAQGNLLINVSQDGGTSWSTASIPTIRGGRLATTSCTGAGNNAICIAGGQSIINSTTAGILFVSTNGGTTWNQVNTNAFSFLGSSCSGSGVTALCAAVGRQASALSQAALYVSRDGGQTWNLQATPNPSQFNSVSCFGGNTGYCVASGLNTATQRALSYISTDGGENWNPWNAPENASVFNSVTCTGTLNTSVCVAVGRDRSAFLPLVYVGSPGLVNWTKKTTTTTNSTFNSVTCVGNSISGTCLAAGQNIIKNLTLLYISKDAGKTWALESSNNAVGSYLSASCTGNDSSLVCSALGNSISSPFIYQSTDNGSSWKIIDLPSKAGTFTDVSCTGTGLNSVCAAAGLNNNGNIPLLYVGKPLNSKSWTWRQVNTGTQQGAFNDVSCTGSGNTSICSAVGTYAANSGVGAPILYVTRNGGASWNLIDTLITSGELSSTSCTGVGNNAICAAAGRNRDDVTWPGLILVSRNGGVNWSQVSTSSNQYLDSVSCSGEGNNAVCIAVGEDYDLGRALIYLSKNGGVSWSMVNTASLTTDGEFLDANCTGNGAKAICTASGQDYITGFSLLYFTQNGGQTWSYQPPLTPPNQDGTILYQTSCTGEARHAVCASAGVYAGDLPSYIYLGLANNSPLLWSLITPSTYSGFLKTANCSGLPEFASCLIGGGEINSTISQQNRPSLYISNNAGKTWRSVSVPPAIVAGQFNDLSSNQ